MEGVWMSSVHRNHEVTWTVHPWKLWERKNRLQNWDCTRQILGNWFFQGKKKLVLWFEAWLPVEATDSLRSVPRSCKSSRLSVISYRWAQVRTVFLWYLFRVSWTSVGLVSVVTSGRGAVWTRDRSLPKTLFSHGFFHGWSYSVFLIVGVLSETKHKYFLYCVYVCARANGCVDGGTRISYTRPCSSLAPQKMKCFLSWRSTTFVLESFCSFTLNVNALCGFHIYEYNWWGKTVYYGIRLVSGLLD